MSFLRESLKPHLCSTPPFHTRGKAIFVMLSLAWRSGRSDHTDRHRVRRDGTTQAVVQERHLQPLLLQYKDFPPHLTESLFIETEPPDGHDEPLVRDIPMEQAWAVVDLVEHRLAKFSLADLKQARVYAGR